ncbi:hypothetical protein BCR32DRAFT_296349 [Anaeromyces robustus]|uniref:RING-type domain-containing protein n=1 Tax=Anaeromyces robustus TaxID=1754192 RepID=A0A1Y1WS86_9FUNG|nr:hypothetical protein BCR32DRAFT_296349 [Anaeromyces robustus]|eukprot:ORX76265.1 hypothetical protein BCR32DRAFT_296349 [Anaeromyces robustus]
MEKRQRKNSSNTMHCPICQETISKTTIKSHFTHHWNNINSNINEKSSEWLVETRKKNRKAAVAAMKKFASKKDFLEDDYERLLSRVKNNRISRINILREKTKRKNKKSDIDNILDDYNNSQIPSTCFMCGTVLYGSLDQINLHIDRCLQQQQQLEENQLELISPSNTTCGLTTNTNNTTDTHNDYEKNTPLKKSKSFDEYTWAGQTRIRATSLHEGSFSDFASNPIGKSKVEDDTDIELNVEDDETEIYGQKQYGEHNIVQLKIENTKKLEEENNKNNTTASPRKKSSIIRITIPKNLIKNSQKNNDSQKENKEKEQKQEDHYKKPQVFIEERKDDKSLIIDALREKIREMEKQQKDVNKCLICLEPFVNPVTSINCWHVFCEKCWLQTLGAKRLCPQCQIITGPGDLRRIYL